MTDPGMADATYVEPLTVEALEKIIAKERPDALLPNLGGQTGSTWPPNSIREAFSKTYGVQIYRGQGGCHRAG